MSTAFVRELRFAWRRLWKGPGATLASVAALACGIGAAVAAWSLLSAVLLKPLPVDAPERLFQVFERPPALAPDQAAMPAHSYAFVEAIRASGAFDGLAVGAGFPIVVDEPGNAPRTRQVHFASHDFFATLGIGAARGRTFTRDDDRRGAPPAAVLSDHYWRRAFGADPNVLGRTVTVAGTAATVVGVLPRGFRGLSLSEAPDLYLPLHAVGEVDYELFRVLDPFTQGGWFRIVGRLRPGDTEAAAAARLNALGDAGPLTLVNVNTGAIAEAARERLTQFTTLLFITVGLLLLIGCLTVGTLLLVRTEDRRDELGVRLALGATRGRLAAGIAAEAAILAALGAALALPVAAAFAQGVRAFELPGRVALELLDLALAPGAWLAATGAAFAFMCAIALVASLVGVGAAAHSPAQSRALATPRTTRRAPRTVLVAGQIAITLVLVSGAGLFTRSLIEALRLNPGVAGDRVVTASIDPGQHGYTPEGAAAFVDELRARLRDNGTIEAVSVADPVGSALAGVSVGIDGVPRVLPSAISYMAIDDAYFSAVGLPIVRGRNVARSDTAGSPRVAVVSESLAKLIAGDGDPLGHRVFDSESFRRIARGEAAAYVEVVGVVPDLVTNVNAAEPLVVYEAASAAAARAGAKQLVFRAAGGPDAAMRDALATVRAMDPRVTLEALTTLDAQIARQMNPQRFGIRVLGALGGIALLVTALGTYAVTQSMTTRRRRELGIRAALGARGGQLCGLVLRDTARLVGAGLAAGLVLAALGAGAVRALLYRVEPLDPLVLGAVAALIFGIALLVSLGPALEATRLGLARSLREE